MLNGNEVTDYWFRRCRKLPVVVDAVQMNSAFFVDGPSGRQHGLTGDYLIRGIDGERYPCPERVFERTYEWMPVSAPAATTRKGRFALDAPQVFSNSPAIASILAAVKVTDARHDLASDRIFYTAESDLFDEIPIDAKAPMYHLCIVFERVVATRADEWIDENLAEAKAIFEQYRSASVLGYAE